MLRAQPSLISVARDGSSSREKDKVSVRSFLRDRRYEELVDDVVELRTGVLDDLHGREAEPQGCLSQISIFRLV
jgi:hypothetical protein